MTNLVNNFKNLISNELFLKLLGYLDEKDALLKRAIEASICAVLVGIEKSNDLEVFLKSSQNLSFDFEAQMNNCCPKESLFSCGYLYLDWLFAVKKDRISEMISNEIGVRSETARIVLNVVSILIINDLKKETPKNLISILESESEIFYRLLPRGVKLILGLTNVDYATGIANENESSLFSFSFLKNKRN
ncbi:MAG: hypothetical protein EAZ58_01660 [Flavobacterium sp.]|nr:MAG: hypothetical protein EAZ58_01660 [Flavobacterium sp.]